MTKRLNSIEQAMELSIHHHFPPQDGPAPEEAGQTGPSPLEAQLDALPARIANALRAEMAKGTLVVTLAAEPGGIRINPVKPRRKRPSRRVTAPAAPLQG